MVALGSLGDPKQLEGREEPQFFRKIDTYAALQLSDEELVRGKDGTHGTSDRRVRRGERRQNLLKLGVHLLELADRLFELPKLLPLDEA